MWTLTNNKLKTIRSDDHLEENAGSNNYVMKPPLGLFGRNLPSEANRIAVSEFQIVEGGQTSIP